MLILVSSDGHLTSSSPSFHSLQSVLSFMLVTLVVCARVLLLSSPKNVISLDKSNFIESIEDW